MINLKKMIEVYYAEDGSLYEYDNEKKKFYPLIRGQAIKNKNLEDLYKKKLRQLGIHILK